MDQAAQLRKLVNARQGSSSNEMKMVSVMSGKGGVGKTSLVKDLYQCVDNSYIVDCDTSSPYFWRHDKAYNCCDGFDMLNGRLVVKPVDKRIGLSKYNVMIVDAGTGINDINRYYVNKSKVTVFVTSMDEIAILNTMNLMKRVGGLKLLYIPSVDNDEVVSMQAKINMYSRTYLDSTHILVTNKLESIINVIERDR